MNLFFLFLIFFTAEALESPEESIPASPEPLEKEQTDQNLISTTSVPSEPPEDGVSPDVVSKNTQQDLVSDVTVATASSPDDSSQEVNSRTSADYSAQDVTSPHLEQSTQDAVTTTSKPASADSKDFSENGSSGDSGTDEGLLLTKGEPRFLSSKLDIDKLYRFILPIDCKEVQNRGYNTSGIYLIRPMSKAFWVLCDMDTRGGGWTYVLNRYDGSQNFYYNLTEYTEGFGDLKQEFWLGLDHLFDITNRKRNELLFVLTDWDMWTAYASYDRFFIGSKIENFVLKSTGRYKGTAGDSFSMHKGMKFSTEDRDLDVDSVRHCAQLFKGGWWFNNCYYSYLNGEYGRGLHWYRSNKVLKSLKQVKMMIRPIN